MIATETADATQPADPAAPLTRAALERWTPRTFFKTGPPGRVGVELELHVVDAVRPAAHLSPGRLAAVTAALAEVVAVGEATREPGGQVELSTAPADSLPALLASTRADLDRMRQAAASHQTRLVGVGCDPVRPARRVLHTPRYDAMEAYFDRFGDVPATSPDGLAVPAGRTMMCASASVQVNVEAGPDEAAAMARRWQLLHTVGPALAATFACSPLRDGRPTGWSSTRLAAWLALDPARTAEPAPAGDLATTYLRFALGAPLLLVRREAGGWHAPPGATFADWLDGGERVVPDRPGPTAADLALHLSTLFPPVRARGHLEVRYVDAQPGDDWVVPVAVIAALVDDPVAADVAQAACEPVASQWRAAARFGAGHPGLRQAAVATLAAAADSWRRRDDPVADAVEGFLEARTVRGRCPADDLLDAAARGEDLL
ncbi:MAG: ergothioneine biosynthesis glutamate--cysteine ligase EgtA [Actinomycetota bacterium]|nr:MAG: ergothioneine biosynthesis glutamate--cysteine ligase EgtA [Actinomycetota bacterium]